MRKIVSGAILAGAMVAAGAQSVHDPGTVVGLHVACFSATAARVLLVTPESEFQATLRRYVEERECIISTRAAPAMLAEFISGPHTDGDNVGSVWRIQAGARPMFSFIPEPASI